MRTLKFDLQVEIKAVVPESFVDAQIEAAGSDDSTRFQQQLMLKYCDALYAAKSDEDISDAKDAFLLELMGNGLRMGLRGHSLAMLEGSGIGGSVAPVQILERIALKPEVEDTVS